MKIASFDIIILGGGLVGLTAANLCAKHNLTVALIEAYSPPLEWSRDQIDNRCSAINRASQNIFKAISIWETIKNERVSAYQSMTVWDALGFGEITFNAAELSETDLGHIIENRVMIKALWEKAGEHSNITLFSPAKPKEVQILSKEVILILESGEQLNSKMIIGADGARSWIRDQLKIETKNWDYQQSALIATVKTEKSHQKTAWQRFLSEGPLAFLPLSESHISSIVWTGTKENTMRRMVLTEADFCQELAHNFDYCLGSIEWIKDRQSFPLAMIHAKQYVGERVALIGDAAHVIHPLAGQGVNLGLLDAASLVEVLVNAKMKEYDIGNRLVLRRYERLRKTQILTMVTAVEFFKQIFGTEFSFFVGIRSLGVNLTHSMLGLKKEILLHAMGLKGDLPAIARAV